LHELDFPGVNTELYQGLSQIPAFVPDLSPVPAEVVDLLARISRADAVLFATRSTPAGSLAR
jgi:NAD(P)H-dependent FMN reductase